MEVAAARVLGVVPEADRRGGEPEEASAMPLMLAPDDVLTLEEAAERLRRSPRQVQRLLASGRLAGRRDDGSAVITALAVWRHLGVEREMTAAWIEYCRREDRGDVG